MDNSDVLKAIAQLRSDLGEQIQTSNAQLKSDLELVRTDMLNQTKLVRTELLNHMELLRTDMLDQIHGVGAQLHAQIEDLDKRFADRSAAAENRLKLQGGIVQSGTRAMARFFAWADGADTNMLTCDHRLTDVEKRLANLEQKST